MAKDLSEFKEAVQASLASNQESMEEAGRLNQPNLKTYLIECAESVADVPPPAGPWEAFPEKGWYRSRNHRDGVEWVLDASAPRVWRLFALEKADVADRAVRTWVEGTHGLDFCWLTRPFLKLWDGRAEWERRGVGLRFEDGLRPEDEQGRFSLKAWYGTHEHVPGLRTLLEQAEESFAIHSTRWRKRVNGSRVLTTEIYSDGKITTNSAADVDEVLFFSQEVSSKYRKDLAEATRDRDQSFAPFEFSFAQPIDLNAFEERVSRASSPMRLWLAESSREDDNFRRYKGVDLHTWDRIYLDVGTDYAYLNIPGKGCVNAAPRLATLQGEDNAGRTEVFHDGVPVFA